MKRIAIFASGSGTNAEAIVKYFAGRTDVSIPIVVSNVADAGVHNRMKQFEIPTITFPKEQWRPFERGGAEGRDVLKLMKQHEIDLIVLAGFLPFVPIPILDAYRNRIVNIHPSLLPRHGGKGMWGHYVHEAVLADGDKESGISIHFVTAEVDGGEVLFQAKCDVLPDDTPDSLAERVHTLEHKHFPSVIDSILSKM